MIQAFVVFVAEFQRASCSSCIHCMNTRIAGLIAFPAWWAQSAWIVSGVSLNGSSTIELLLYRKARQKAHPQIARHALLDTLNTPQFVSVLHGNAVLAQDAFKNLPEHALGLVDDKAQRDRLPRGWRAAA